MLSRYDGLGSLIKGFKDTRAALSAGGRVKVPGEDATAEEVAEFAKAFGIPEKPEDYKITAQPPEGFEVGDDDKAFLDRLRPRAKAMGMNQKQFDAFTSMFFEEAASAQNARDDRYAQSAVRADQELRTLFGSRFEENVRLANAAASQFFKGEVADLIDVKVQTADGFVGNLGDWPKFVDMMQRIGRANAEDPYFQQAAGLGSGEGPEAQLAKLMELKRTDPNKYASEETQNKIDRLLEAIQRKKGLSGSGDDE